MSTKYLARFLPAIVLAGGLLLSFGAPGAAARTPCQVRVDRAEARLSSAVYHHGELSYRATRDRARLNRIERQCRLD